MTKFLITQNGLLMVLAFATIGCVASDDRDVVVSDSLGVQVVQAKLEGVKAGRLLVDTLPFLSVGKTEGAERELLFRVTAARLLPNGKLIVLNSGTSQVRLYDIRGQEIWSAGGEGKGPGEFAEMSGLILGQDASTGVFDPSLSRITFFDSLGNMAGTQTMYPPPSGQYGMALYKLLGRDPESGHLILAARAYNADMTASTATFRDTVPNMAYSPQGRFIAYIGHASGMDMYSTGKKSGAVRFGRVSSVALHNDQFYVSDGGDFEVAVYGLSKSLRKKTAVYRIAAPQRAVSQLELMSDPLHAFVKDAPAADTKPWIAATIVDSLGMIWVQQYEARGNRNPRRWIIFHPEGDFVSEVFLPSRFQVEQIGATYILGVDRDPDLGERIVAFQIKR